MIATLIALALALLLLAGCVIVYAGDTRLLQPQCMAFCDATAARVEGAASGGAGGTITQDSQGPLSPRISK